VISELLIIIYEAQNVPSYQKLFDRNSQDG
jgi:hypothetical protein